MLQKCRILLKKTDKKMRVAAMGVLLAVAVALTVLWAVPWRFDQYAYTYDSTAANQYKTACANKDPYTGETVMGKEAYGGEDMWFSGIAPSFYLPEQMLDCNIAVQGQITKKQYAQGENHPLDWNRTILTYADRPEDLEQAEYVAYTLRVYGCPVGNVGADRTITVLVDAESSVAELGPGQHLLAFLTETLEEDLYVSSCWEHSFYRIDLLGRVYSYSNLRYTSERYDGKWVVKLLWDIAKAKQAMDIR